MAITVKNKEHETKESRQEEKDELMEITKEPDIKNGIGTLISPERRARQECHSRKVITQDENPEVTADQHKRISPPGSSSRECGF